MTQAQVARPHVDPRLSVAPMMQCTDVYFRRVMRAITRRTTLYTEMVTTSAIERLVEQSRLESALECAEWESPVVFQLGGTDTHKLAACAKIVEQLGYDEVNLNAGCPSPAVQSGAFGVTMMRDPANTAACTKAMKDVVALPVTIKHRIGIVSRAELRSGQDEAKAWDFLSTFVEQTLEAGSDGFIVHAREACLEGINPADNRTIPPLRPHLVHRLKEQFPGSSFETNGGIKTIAEAIQCTQPNLDGAMIGRAARDQPMHFALADQDFYGESSGYKELSQLDQLRRVVNEVASFVEEKLREGAAPSFVVRPLQNLAHGLPGAKQWRQQLLALNKATPTPCSIQSELFRAVDRLQQSQCSE